MHSDLELYRRTRISLHHRSRIHADRDRFGLVELFAQGVSGTPIPLDTHPPGRLISLFKEALEYWPVLAVQPCSSAITNEADRGRQAQALPKKVRFLYAGQGICHLGAVQRW